MLRILAALIVPATIYFSFLFDAAGGEPTAAKLRAGDRIPAVSAPAGLEDPEGRYSLHDAEGGLLRLDKQTGALSFCYRAGKDWRCEAAGDEVAACEQRSAALDARVKLMEDRLARLVEQMPRSKDEAAKNEAGKGEAGKGEAGKGEAGKGGAGKGEAESRFNLPDRQDIDRMLTYLEDVMGRMMEKMKELTEDKKDGRKI